MPLSCPRCKHVNPDQAVFCYYDGAELRASQDGAGPAFNRMSQPFVFPSGRRCTTYDELAKGCEEEWDVARNYLQNGSFSQFFIGSGRADLAKAIQDANEQSDPDTALTTFLASLPVTTGQAPELELTPRRFLLGKVMAGESRQLTLTVSNRGRGALKGTVRVTEGNEWLKLGSPDAPADHTLIQTSRVQQVTFWVDMRGVPSLKRYAGKLTVITNGGVVEVPVRLDLVPHAFPHPPFRGARTPREIAVKMKNKPKEAGPVFERGLVAEWFARNGWEYPVKGEPVKGVGGVQQFFEAMGLSKPPKVSISQPEVRFQCKYPQRLRFQLVLSTPERKWVYATVQSNQPWLKVLTPHVSGPRKAEIAVEIDSQRGRNGTNEGQLQLSANGQQTISVRAYGQIQGVPTARGVSSGFLMPLVTMALMFVCLRLLLIPFVDVFGRSGAAQVAFQKIDQKPAYKQDIGSLGGWLQLPMGNILVGGAVRVPVQKQNDEDVQFAVGDFRHYFIQRFIRSLLLWTWWLGPLLGVFFVFRKGGNLADLPWAVIAGVVAGLIGASTLACLVLALDLIPHLMWGTGQAGFASLLIWSLLVLIWWTIVGGVVGLVCHMFAPLQKTILMPLQKALSGLIGLFGMKGLAALFSPKSA